ncbi:MAG: FAD-dependent thymidylate synthase [Chthonomonadales bacterium]|nr:FAD-dependent thymidylate synthase [Chthonomonadales bacterium]
MVLGPGDHPTVYSPVHVAPGGARYLTHPGVVTLARPNVAAPHSAIGDATIEQFLSGFDDSLGFRSSLQDPVELPPAAALCKVAGQLCYMSFGPKRTTNAEAARYFANIRGSGHGSVLEHATFTFLCYGISRSVTHELVRHRAGFAFSQVSQRYVSAQTLRFVERPEFRETPELHRDFEARIDETARRHALLEQQLAELQLQGSEALAAQGRTARRKRIQQAARALLPNETEAPVVVTANVRAWRHFIEARANEHADVEIRMLAYAIYLCLRHMEPLLFGDYDETKLPDGTTAVSTATPKV